MCLSQPTFKPDSFLSRGKNVNFVIFSGVCYRPVLVIFGPFSLTG